MDCSKRSAGAVSSLPDDPLVEIFSRVPVKSLCRFKCVSKAWRDLIADPLHRKKLPQTLEGFFFDGNSAGNNLPRQVYVRFVDVLGRSVRPELPGIEYMRLLHHCNGLLLFGYIQESAASLSYIVSNPATDQWVAVPSSDSKWYDGMLTSLIFYPAVSSHFHLVQIKDKAGIPVHVYSSKSGVWSPVGHEWPHCYISPVSRSAHVNGMLYVVLHGRMDQIAVMEVEGKTRKIIPVPLRAGDEFRTFTDYVGQSQGRLHCIYHADLSYLDEPPLEKKCYELFTWVLEDYETQQWILKDTVSFFHLFGKRSCLMNLDYNVVGIHPHHNLVFLVQHWNQKLISYHMESKLVRHLCTLEHGYRCITPYVPYYSEFSALENKP